MTEFTRRYFRARSLGCYLHGSSIIVRLQNKGDSDLENRTFSLAYGGVVTRIPAYSDNDVMKNWYEQDRIYDGTGAPKLFSDFAITICHELRQVFKLPLRQCQGFIYSIFQKQEIFLRCPDYSCLSKRLATLALDSPRYKKSNTAIENIAAIAIDSTGLKRFGRDEWHQEKHRISANRSWRKLHVVELNFIEC